MRDDSNAGSSKVGNVGSAHTAGSTHYPAGGANYPSSYRSVTAAAVGPMFKRISWGAVFAGLVIALVVQLTLSLLGIAVGASAIDPLQGDTPGKGIAIGAGIWFLVSTLISMYIGACVAAHLAGTVRRSDSVLHGVLTWGATTLFTVFLLTSALGNLIGGAMGVLGKAASSAGQAAGQAVGQEASASGEINVDVDSLKQKAQQMIGQASGASGAQSSQQGGQAASSPEKDPEVVAAMTRMYSRGGPQANPQDRQAVENILVTRYGMDRQEASATIQQWQQKLQQTKAQAEQKAREAGEAAASATSQAAFWSFLILVLGAAAAAFGGASARRGTVEAAPIEPVRAT